MVDRVVMELTQAAPLACVDAYDKIGIGMMGMQQVSYNPGVSS